MDHTLMTFTVTFLTHSMSSLWRDKMASENWRLLHCPNCARNVKFGGITSLDFAGRVKSVLGGGMKSLKFTDQLLGLSCLVFNVFFFTWFWVYKLRECIKSLRAFHYSPFVQYIKHLHLMCNTDAVGISKVEVLSTTIHMSATILYHSQNLTLQK